MSFAGLGGYFEQTAADTWADDAYAEMTADPDVEAFEAMQERSRTTEIQRQLEEAADLAGADSVDIKGESDAAIGANGEKIQNYIQENEAIVSRPLNLGETGMTGPEVSAGMPSYGIGGIGYDDRSDWDDSSDFEEDEFDEKASEAPETELGDTPLGRRVVPLEDPTDEMVDGPELGDESSSGGMSTEPYEVREYAPMGMEQPSLADRAWSGLTRRVKGFLNPKRYAGARSPELNESFLSGEERALAGGSYTEMTELGPNLGDSMHLADRPTQSELSGAMPDDVRQGLNELVKSARKSGMSDRAIAEEFHVGMGSSKAQAAAAATAATEEVEMWMSKAAVSNYVLKQGKGLLATPFVVPLVLWLNEADEGLGDAVSAGMVGMDLIASGDPLGAVLWGAGQFWDAENESRQKVIDNDTPDKDYGARLGYVREGDKWYPAIYNKRYKSTGLKAGDSEMTLDYGDEIIWQFDRQGNMVPVIPGAKSKQFVVHDDEWDRDTGHRNDYEHMSGKGFISGGEGVKMKDTTRDWYFLTTEETKKVASGESQLASYEDDVEQMNPVVREVNDWRKALEYGQDWKWSSAVATMGEGAAVNSYEGSRGLQRITYEAVGRQEAGVRMADTDDFDAYIKQHAKEPGDHGTKDTYSDYIFEHVIKDHIKTLYAAQNRAARQAGFDKLYTNKALTDYESGAGVASGVAGTGRRDSNMGTAWSALYLDTAKDMPVATTAEELKQQLHEIELYNDRTSAQRNYLSQKVQTRYWMQQAVQMGESSKLLEYMGGRSFTEEDPYDMKQYTQPAVSQYLTMMQDADLDDPDKVLEDLAWGVGYDPRKYDLGVMNTFAMPWQNAGEDWLPTLTGALQGTSAKDYMDDFEATNYDRLGQSAKDNTTKWINATGKWDPNQRIEGVNAELQEGGLYAVQTTDPAATKRVTFEDDTQAAQDVQQEAQESGKKSAQFNVMPPDPTAMRGDSATGSVGPDTAYIKDLREKVRSFADAPATHRLDGENNNDWIDRIKDILERSITRRKEEIEEEKAAAEQKKAQIAEEHRTTQDRDREMKKLKFDLEHGAKAEREAKNKQLLHEFILEDNKAEINEWQELGKKLGLLDDDFDAFTQERPTATNSHVPDTTVATHGVHTPMSHSIDHEEYNLPPMTSAYMAAIHAAESQVPAPTAQTVKVI